MWKCQRDPYLVLAGLPPYEQLFQDKGTAEHVQMVPHMNDTLGIQVVN